MNKRLLVKKIENYSLYIGLASIFIAIWFPIFNYVSTGAFAITYVTALIRQYQKNGKIDFISFVLCSASMVWVITRQFIDSPYIMLAGQVILYSYLLNTQKQLLGKVNGWFLGFILMAIALGFMRVFYPSTLTNILNLIMQVVLIYRFLDPVLESIALRHRAKRLAMEAEQKKKQEEQFLREDVESVEVKEDSEEEGKKESQYEEENTGKDYKENVITKSNEEGIMKNDTEKIC